jgi:phosphate uptake regulator
MTSLRHAAEVDLDSSAFQAATFKAIHCALEAQRLNAVTLGDIALQHLSAVSKASLEWKPFLVSPSIVPERFQYARSRELDQEALRVIALVQPIVATDLRLVRAFCRIAQDLNDIHTEVAKLTESARWFINRRSSAAGRASLRALRHISDLAITTMYGAVRALRELAPDHAVKALKASAEVDAEIESASRELLALAFEWCDAESSSSSAVAVATIPGKRAPGWLSEVILFLGVLERIIRRERQVCEQALLVLRLRE